MKRKVRKLQRRVHKLPVLHILIVAFTIIILSFFSFIVYTVYSAPKYTAKVQYVQTKDAKLAYYVRGKGEPIILISGFGMTMQHWDPLFIEKLSKGNQVLMIDYRGVGESTGDVKDISSDEMAQDVITVMDNLGIDKAHILGWSLGSFVAQIVAEKYPNRVDQLILIGTAPGGKEAVQATGEIQKKVEDNLAGSWEKTYAPLMFADQKDTKAYIERLAEAQASKEAPKGKGESLEAKIAHQHAFADEGREEARYLNLDKIVAPTLILTGGKDQLTTLENAKKVEKRIKNSEHYVVENAGHAVMFENVEESTNIIKAFLQEK